MSDKHSVKSAQTILLARIQDAVDLCDKRHKPQFIGFLDEKEQLYTEKITSQMGFKNYMFWGGHTSSERVVFGAFPDYIEPSDNLFPIQTITVTFRTCDQLSHRDFLGALLSLGIERETLGDFLIEDGRCVFFVREEISQFILMQVKKIGRVGVTLKEGAEFPLPMGRGFTEFSFVVASPRLDCVTAALVGYSREKSGAAIKAGLVTQNYQVAMTTSQKVDVGDKISIRGKGKFVLDRIGPMTKKGRLSIFGRKYK